MYGDGKCKLCGFDDYRALTLDHVRADGATDRRTMFQGQQRKVYRHAISEYMPGKYRVLCWNCQWLERWGKTYWNIITSDDVKTREAYRVWSMEFMRRGLTPKSEIKVYGPHAAPEDCKSQDLI